MSTDEQIPMVPKGAPHTSFETPRSSSPRDTRSVSDHAKSAEKSNKGPRYHKQAILLLVIYIPLLVVPWILTCIMSKRPLNASSYYFQHGFLDQEVKRMENWVNVINVLNSIASLITIPVLSALVAQAAAVYSQRHTPASDAHLQYVAALADHGWTDLIVLVKSWQWRGRGARDVRSLLYFAAVAILLGMSSSHCTCKALMS